MAIPSKSALEIFEEAREFESPQEREAFLRSRCSSDSELRSQVDKLLEVYNNLGNFLVDPPTIVQWEHDSTVVMEGPGDVIGEFELVEEIGEGGFGIVYVAEQTNLVRRRVALKVVKPGMDTREVIARFEQERQLLASLDHPHIAKLFSGGKTESGRPYFVMELVDGVPLTRYCDEHRLSIRERLRLFVKICRAIHHAHKRNIIHRDIKPPNILVTEHDGEPFPKVIDFGVAKAVSQPHTTGSLFTRSGQLIGTPQYMSPEQAVLEELELDERTDIYSLGVVLFELLTGSTPLESKTLRGAAYDEICRRIRTEVTPPPSRRVSEQDEAMSDVAAARGTDPKRLRSALRGELDWIVAKALEKDRERRYDSAGALADDIEAYLDGRPIVASRPGIGTRLRAFGQRHDGWRPAVLATLLLLCGLLGWWALSARSPGQATRSPSAGSPGQATRSWQPPDATAPFTPPHPWLEPCRLVLLTETGATIDLEAAKQFVMDSNQQLFTDAVLAFDPARRAEVSPTLHVEGDWLLWEVPLSTRWDRRLSSTGNSAIVPPQVSLKLRLAVSRKGTIQIGSMGDSVEEHLFILAEQIGFPNYKTFSNGFLPADKIGTPRDSILDLHEPQTLFAWWLADLYHDLENGRIARNGPADYAELYRCPMTIRNYMDKTIVVTQGQIFHQKFIGVEYTDAEKVTQQAKNDRWSPAPDEVDESPMKAQMTVELQYTGSMKDNLSSLLYVITRNDRHNRSAFRVSGVALELTQYLQIDGDPSKADTSVIGYDAAKGTCSAISRNVAGARAILYDQMPTKIELQAHSVWSTVNPSFRFVTFGFRPKATAQVSAVVHENEEEPREIPPAPMELQQWVIPPSARN